MVFWHYRLRRLHSHYFGFSIGCQQTGVWLWKGALRLAFSGHSRAQQAKFAFYLFVCPADDNNCPNTYADQKVNVDVTDLFYEREIEWDMEIPNSSYDWHCKYIVSAGS